MTLLNKYVGAMVGVHVGDSLGAPYETWGPKEIAADIVKRGSLTFFDYPNPWVKEDRNGKTLPAGRPTDDSDQTADLAYSLIECNGLNPGHLREALRDSIVRGQSRLWDGQATGAGGTTKKALSDKPEEVKKGLSNNIGTNGSLMRSTPMALWFGPGLNNQFVNTIKAAKELVSEMSAVTHTHPHAKEASWTYTVILSQLLDGVEIDQAILRAADPLGGLRGSKLSQRVLLQLQDQDSFPYDPGSWPMRGTAEFSLYVALYALLESKSFAEGIEIAVRVGGDTDTYAAIAGGLLGAHYGYEGIPEEWRDTIKGHNTMVRYANQLYDIRLYK